MKILLLSTLLVLSLAGCLSSSDSIVVELRSTGTFVKDVRIDDLQSFLSKIEGSRTKSLVFMVNPDAESKIITEAMITSNEFKFKEVSVSSL